MRVDDYMTLVDCLVLQPEGMPTFHVGEDPLNLGRRAGKLAGLGQASVVSEIDHVHAQAFHVQARPDGEVAARGLGRARAAGIERRLRHTGTRDPRVVGAIQPVLVG